MLHRPVESTAPGLRVAEHDAGHWPGSRNYDYAGNRDHLPFHQGWQCQFVLPLRRQAA
ncbi:protein of unknown function (plasmid) [Cupriavidus taiwanensis]|uniref:Uncharacterized protein n=1 Tax=Cupriavidus taiwanensis TaxID=164546 RepID=A0A375IVS6_9BURK|nr:protein of unknown function [Cupriavidus taiwanensis]